jgi:hypothetical protein
MIMALKSVSVHLVVGISVSADAAAAVRIIIFSFIIGRPIDSSYCAAVAAIR